MVRTSGSTPLHSTPFHSIPFHSIPVHSITSPSQVQSVTSHSIPFHYIRSDRSGRGGAHYITPKRGQLHYSTSQCLQLRSITSPRIGRVEEAPERLVSRASVTARGAGVVSHRRRSGHRRRTARTSKRGIAARRKNTGEMVMARRRHDGDAAVRRARGRGYVAAKRRVARWRRDGDARAMMMLMMRWKCEMRGRRHSSHRAVPQMTPQ